MSARFLWACLSCSFLIVAASPAGTAAGRADAPPEAADFTGRTEAPVTVDVRARVTGYLAKAAFKEGAEVKQGDALFEIDPRPYQAEVARTDAALAAAEAHVKRAEIDFKRAKALLDRSAISREEYDKLAGDLDEAKALVVVAKASRDIASLNLSFTKVAAPIAGRVGRRLVDPGNIVKADETTVTTIVGDDPMYVYFDMDERTYLSLRQAMRDGKIKVAKMDDLPVAVGLANEDGFLHKGKIDFVDNRVDAAKGTIRVRVVLPNADGLLVPGLFARVRLTMPDKK
jgi:RND family efflux transporter MFP subunit